jgi:hypothetical protein
MSRKAAIKWANNFEGTDVHVSLQEELSTKEGKARRCLETFLRPLGIPCLSRVNCHYEDNNRRKETLIS